MKKTIFFLLIFAIILYGAYLILRSDNGGNVNNGNGDIVQATPTSFESLSAEQLEILALLEESRELGFTRQADLTDVTGGDSSGEVYADLVNGEYHMVAAFADLPELDPGFFYEGWVVRKSPVSVISTGKTVDLNQNVYNYHTSSDDLLDHDFYVLTIEPDDGDPAPADHILEGTLRVVR